MVSSPSSDKLEVMSINTPDIKLKIIRDSEETSIACRAKNEVLPNIFNIVFNVRERLLLDAANNRTRERNYYMLYSRLLEGCITEEEFDKELDDNSDDYQISIDKVPSMEEFNEAMNLSSHIKDADSVGKIETLFSFDGETVDKYCKQIENGAI